MPLVSKPEKHCKRCGCTDWYEEVTRKGPQTGQIHHRCGACSRRTNKAWRDAHPNANRSWWQEHKEVYRERHRKRRENGRAHACYLRAKHGITSDDYARLLKEQNGVCAICKHTCKTGRKLSVDHNHETGEVRGLLCTRCNLFLGHIEDPRTQTALAYLKKRRRKKLFSKYVPDSRPMGFKKST